MNLSLFGSFVLKSQARVVVLPTRKCEALLAVLSLSQGCSAPREEIAALLWSDVPRTQGRHSLRQTILAVRRVLTANGIGTLEATREVVTLAAPDLEIDVVRFEQLVNLGTADALDTAIKLFRGPLLEGFFVREAPFDRWLRGQRARFAHLALDAHVRRLELLRGAGDTERALRLAHKLIALHPDLESVHEIIGQLLVARARERLDDAT